MALQYRIISRRNPQTGAVEYFPTLVLHKKPATMHEIAKLVSEMSSVSPGDCYDVLITLGKACNVFMGDGRGCQLEGLGSLSPRINASGNGKLSPSLVSVSDINSVLVRFKAERRKSGHHYIVPLVDGFQFELVKTHLNRYSLQDKEDSENRLAELKAELERSIVAYNEAFALVPEKEREKKEFLIILHNAVEANKKKVQEEENVYHMIRFSLELEAEEKETKKSKKKSKK